MNKKASLIGNTVILQYSFIILAFIVVGFAIIYLLLSGSQLIPGISKLKVNIEPGSEIGIYDFLDYYLYTKIKVDNKETNLLELIPIYCHNKDKALAEDIRKISKILFPYFTSRSLACVNEKTSCKNVPNEYNILGEKFYYRDKGIIIFNEISSHNLKIIEIPGLEENSKACLEIENKKYDINTFVDSVYSEKEFEEKVKQKSAFKDIQDKASFLISPSKDIWRYNNNMWCNPLKETNEFLSCNKGISSQELITCKGDIKICDLT